ncbi:MAG: hypothetical protein KJ818_07195, partial [Candidatus Omnitrophica bacterium]|nr:hypothetical protein [Candidatus Omnitrophota bacterium]
YPNYFYFIGLILLALALYAVRKSAKLLRNPFYLYSFSFPLFLTAVLLNIIPTSFQLGIASDPFRGMFIFILTVSSLAASGTDMFLKSLGTRKRFYLPVELFVAGVISFVVCFSTDISDGFVSARNFIFILGLLIFINLALELLIRKKGLNFAKFIFPVWIVALACINCFPNSWNYLKTNVLHDSTTLVDKWRNQGLDIKELSGEWRVMHLGPDGDIFKGLLEQWADYYRIRSIGAYGEFYPKTVFMRIRDDGLITNPYNAATHYKNNTITDPDLLSKYGVLYLISDNSYERKPKEKEWQLLKKFEDISVYKNPKYIGRSYIVDKEGKIVKGAQILEDKNSYIKISVNANAGDTLILADSWFPGWTCYDNGKKAPGFDDRGFRGRNIESDGDHIIEWVYKPKLFYIGAFISFGGIFIFILLCLVELILRKLKSNRRRGL